jgi:hypothetical protein
VLGSPPMSRAFLVNRDTLAAGKQRHRESAEAGRWTEGEIKCDGRRVECEKSRSGLPKSWSRNEARMEVVCKDGAKWMSTRDIQRDE